jgi:hypothetical protein
MQYCILGLTIRNTILHNSKKIMKTKGQRPQVAKLELLARCNSGEVAERSTAAGLHPARASQAFTGSNPVLSATIKHPPLIALTTRGA